MDGDANALLDNFISISQLFHMSLLCYFYILISGDIFSQIVQNLWVADRFTSLKVFLDHQIFESAVRWVRLK